MKILPSGIAVLDGDAWISRWVEETGRLDHDQNMLPHLLKFIKPGDWVVDGGAFIGDHTIAYLNAVGEFGMVFAFEPNHDAFECLSKNCPKAIKFKCGLGSGWNKSVVVHNPNRGASHLTIGEASQSFRYDEIEGGVRVAPLDSLHFDRLNFVKLDLEGCETMAIRGARDSIKTHKPIICVEFNPSALAIQGSSVEELTKEICDLGYGPPENVYPEQAPDPLQADMIFRPL